MVITIDSLNGAPPTKDELGEAPTLYRWLLKDTRGGVEVHGMVHKHPHLPDGQWIRTAELVQMDPGSKPFWLRTESRLYCLGRKMGRCEYRIRRDLWMSHLAVWTDRPEPEELREFDKLFRQRRTHLDEVERILLLLVRNDRMDLARARHMHKSLLVELSR